MFALHKLLDVLLTHGEHHEHNHEDHDHGHIASFIENKNQSFFKAGILLLLALIFHNFPEGMSLGLIYKNSFEEGISLGVSFAIHNFVMGVTMSLPLLLSDMKKRNILLLVSISFLPSLIGSLVGYSTELNTIFNYIVLTISAGILLFVIFEELVPNMHDKKQFIYAFLCFLLGFLITMLCHFIL